MLQNQAEIDRLKTVIQQVLDEAKQQGASAAEASLSIDNGLSASARLGEVETGISLRSRHGGDRLFRPPKRLRQHQ